jgi:hypothetical protein
MSISSGRYQSSFFSFLSQQSLRFKDKAQQVWRKAKIAAVWGAQIALYPVYLLFQSGRLAGKQMGNAVRQWLQLEAAESVPADTPIQKALAAAAGLVAAESIAIQGIASSLSDRSLVLVTTDFQILDVLTPAQQLELQRRIVWEMAIHWRQHRIQIQDRGATFLPLPQAQPRALPPVRAFWQWLAWMQQSPVAIATNLFQESRLALAPEPPLETWQPAFPFPLFNWIKNQSTDLSQKLNQLLTSSIVLYDPIAPIAPEPSMPTMPPLTIDDFFSGEFIGVSTVTAGAIVPTVQPATAIQPTVKETRSGVRKAAAPKANLVRTGEGAIEGSRAGAADRIPDPTMEAEVQVLGYEKHWLERLLSWLDAGMLWLEQRLVAIWRWLWRVENDRV